MTDIIKCNKCGNLLISGKGCIALFGKGTSIGCVKCGNEYTFEDETIVSNNSLTKPTKLVIE